MRVLRLLYNAMVTVFLVASNKIPQDACGVVLPPYIFIHIISNTKLRTRGGQADEAENLVLIECNMNQI